MAQEEDINKRRKGLSRRDAIKRMGQGLLGATVLSLSGLDLFGSKSYNKAIIDSPDINDPGFSGLPIRKDLSKLLKKKSSELPEFTVFRNVNVIPMNKEEVLLNYDVIINNGKIQDLGKSGEIRLPEGSSVALINGKDKFLIPGLVDMHTHYFNKDDLLLFAVNGVTTTRCMNGNESVLSYRKEVNTGIALGPKIFTASPTIADDNLIDKLSVDNDIDDSGFDFVLDVEECREAVNYYKIQGYDYIKIFDPLNRNFYVTIIKEAEKQKIKVVGHVPDDVDPITSKQHSIEHFFNNYLTKNLEAVAKAGVWVCPTLYVYNVKNNKSKELEANLKYAGKRLKKEWIRWNNFYVANDLKPFAKIGEFVKMGGKIVAGTDCRMQHVMPGFSIHKELDLYVKYGVSAYEALKSATINAADCLGTLATSGTIEKGKNADLLLLNGNPLQSIKNTDKIQGVMVSGQWIDKAEVVTILKQVEEERA